jgi:hypothetical protein
VPLFRVTFLSHKTADPTADVVNVLHVVAKDDPSWEFAPDPNAQAIADEIDTQLTSLYRAMLANTYTLASIDVLTVTDPNQPAQVPSGYTKPKNLAGTLIPVDDELPQQVCALMHLKTATRGRSARGWLFAPPAEQKDLVNNDLFGDPSNYLNAINAFCTKLNAHFGGGSTWSSAWTDTWHGRFVIYSRRRHKLALTPYTFPVVSASTDRTVHWLRSRAK